MLPLIREIIDNSKFSHIAVTEIASLLPDEDSELDRWLGEAINPLFSPSGPPMSFLNGLHPKSNFLAINQ